jgi:hypothetical protein
VNLGSVGADLARVIYRRVKRDELASTEDPYDGSETGTVFDFGEVHREGVDHLRSADLLGATDFGGGRPMEKASDGRDGGGDAGSYWTKQSRGSIFLHVLRARAVSLSRGRRRGFPFLERNLQ